MKKCYSTNEEDYVYDSIEDAAASIWDDQDELKVGDTVTIFEADATIPKASSFAPLIDEAMTEAAYGIHGEYSEVWEFTREESRLLQEAVQEAIDKWCDENDMQPNFYKADRVAPIKVRFVSEEGDVEVVTE